MKKTGTVNEYIAKETIWQDELIALVEVLRQTDLAETIKWGAPCYTHDGKNIVGVMAFKAYFGLWFHQGVFLKDEAGVLINAQDGKTRALRQWRMTDADEIKPALIKRYLKEAVQIEKDGRAIKPEKKKLIMPPELTQALASDALVKAKFDQFRPGHQREFADYISEAKRDDTKARRLKKILPMIKAGIGLGDKYR